MSAPGVERVLWIAESEPEGDHYLSHYVLVRKVLQESVATAVQFAEAFAHHKLTRAECEGMAADWRAEGWLP
jgi:hypothetical protein